jgi:hypothetical protein
MASRRRDVSAETHGSSIESTALLPFDEEPDLAVVVPSVKVQPEGPSLLEEKRSVRVARPEDHPPEIRYRVLKKIELYYKANQIRFVVGAEFNESKYGPAVIENFVKAGLELERIK